MDIKILCENNDYVVCLKPSGVTAEDGGKPGMPSLLGGECSPCLTVHRLDREVGGVTVYAKNKIAAAKLSQQMQNGKFNKEYYAVVSGEIEREGRFEDYLFKDSTKNKSFVVKRERKGVKYSALSYEVIKTAEYDNSLLSLVKIHLETGRTHQIRVQFSHRNHSVFGDKKYGSKFSGGFGLFLKKISFLDIHSNAPVSFVSDFPEGLPWDIFK